MNARGELAIQHQDALLKFVIRRARYGVHSPKSVKSHYGLWLDIECADPPNDHPLAALGPPHLTASEIDVESPDPACFVGRVFEFELDPDEQTVDGPYANIYLSHHTTPYVNRIRLKKDNAGELSLVWIGECPDINYYDARAEDNEFKLRCRVEKSWDLNVEAIVERGGLALDEFRYLFSFYRCPACKDILLNGLTADRRSIRFYTEPDDLTSFADASANVPICPRDGTLRDDLQKLYLEQDAMLIQQSQWKWSIR